MNEALKSQNRDHWIQAMDRELKSLNANDTWEIVNKPDETTILNTKWIFKKKGTENGERRYKARLVKDVLKQKALTTKKHLHP